jgi:hypothetical protein
MRKRTCLAPWCGRPATSTGFSGRSAKQLAKTRRRLEREGRVELRAVEPVGELEPVLEESFALEAAGWKGRSKKAILSSERMTRFYRDVFEIACASGGPASRGASMLAGQWPGSMRPLC